MPTFKYLAKTLDGKTVNGSLTADSAAEAVGELRRKNMVVLNVEQSGAKSGKSIGAMLDVSGASKPGKGRKERVVPLWKGTARQLRSWLDRIDHRFDAPVFPNRAGKRLSRSGVEHRLQVTIEKASQQCPSLIGRRISPH